MTHLERKLGMREIIGREVVEIAIAPLTYAMDLRFCLGREPGWFSRAGALALPIALGVGLGIFTQDLAVGAKSGLAAWMIEGFGIEVERTLRFFAAWYINQ